MFLFQLGCTVTMQGYEMGTAENPALLDSTPVPPCQHWKVIPLPHVWWWFLWGVFLNFTSFSKILEHLEKKFYLLI